LFLNTSKAVWDKLNSHYAAQSRARAMQMRMQLATLKKHSLSAADYFNRVTGITDNLAAAGEPLREDEIIAYLLTGLPEEYDSLVTSVTTRAEPMSLSDVYTNLLSFEARLINRQEASAAPGSLMANYASRGGRGGRHNGGRSGGRSGGRGGGCSGGRSGSNNDHGAAKSVDAPIMLQLSAGIAMTTPTRRKTSTQLLRHPLRHTPWMRRGTPTRVPQITSLVILIA
jgi:hypothetical protein